MTVKRVPDMETTGEDAAEPRDRASVHTTP